MKQMKTKRFTFHQKTDNKLLMTEDCFRHHIKMKYQKITNLLGNISDKVPRFITKKRIKVHDQSGDPESLRSDLFDYSDAYIVVKGDVTVEGAENKDRKNRS